MPQAQTNKTSRLNPGAFKKGYDPRRHTFTPEQRARGYENAQISVNEIYAGRVCRHGAAFSHCLLRVKHPEFFERR